MNALRHFLLALQFFTRIPITGALARWVGWSPAMLRAAAVHFPGVGWVVGAWAAALFLVAQALLPGPAGVWAAAWLATLGTVWLTGAFHEDGLADLCDGLGGGRTPERTRTIMKDSRIGAFGALALVLALGLKAALLATLAQQGAPWAALALLVAHVLSRWAPLVPMARLPYVGDLGTESGASKAKPLADAAGPRTLVLAALWALPALGLVGALAGPWRAAGLLLALAIAVAALLRLMRRRVGGFTGDTLGATQQVSELAVYLALAVRP